MKNAFVYEATIIDNQTIHLNEPINISNKNIIVTTQPIDEDKKTTMKNFHFGCLKGKIEMSDDFDEPLEDFMEYMK